MGSKGLGSSGFRPPPLPEDLEASALPKRLYNSLLSLSSPRSEKVGKYMAGALRFETTDSSRALKYAQAAVSMANRLASAREVYGRVALSAKDFVLALRQLRAAWRISGRADCVPLIAECLSGLGQPAEAIQVLEQALAAESLSLNQRTQLVLAEVRVRIRLGQYSLAWIRLTSVPKYPDFLAAEVLGTRQWLAKKLGK